MDDERYARHEGFFGKVGQARIRKVRGAIVGLGGTGSHVAIQLAYLGVLDFRLIDKDPLDSTSLNRVITAVAADIRGPELKVDVAERAISAIQPTARIQKIPKSFISDDGFCAIKDANVVFGCVDRDSARLVLNELCQAYEIPLVDIATDIDSEDPRDFGGRCHFSTNGERCLCCDDLLDQDSIRLDFESTEQRAADERIYGVPRSALSHTGPSVVSLNGLLVSAALLEFMVDLTELRGGKRWLEYRGPFGTVQAKVDAPKEHCPYCKGSLIRGQREKADVERYLRGRLGDRI